MAPIDKRRGRPPSSRIKSKTNSKMSSLEEIKTHQKKKKHGEIQKLINDVTKFVHSKFIFIFLILITIFFLVLSLYYDQCPR